MAAFFQDFQRLKADFAQNPYPSLRERRDWLHALEATIRLRQDDLYKAAAADFGQRSASDTRLLEILPTIANLKHTRRHLKQWMKPSKRHVSWLFQPASNQVWYQPKGVVGIIVPWNYPLYLAFGPLIAALAAGNRAMIKMSEFTPELNKVVKSILTAALPHQVVVVEGDAHVAAQFSELPWDHLLYTGSTAVGHHVMQAAAKHLTPVTLELGGKSPVIWGDCPVTPNYVDRLLFGKTANGGQTCVAPDYLLTIGDSSQALVAMMKQQIQQFYPQGLQSPNWTSIINERHYARLARLLDDAKARGAEIIELMPPTTQPSVAVSVAMPSSANELALERSDEQESAEHVSTQAPSLASQANPVAVSLSPIETQSAEQPSSAASSSKTSSSQRLMGLTLVLNAPLDCELWQQEIFGPILPIHQVETLTQALEFIRLRPRPLALYLFSRQAAEQRHVLSQSHAGGMCINETLVHVGQDDLPFGGIGPSGMGQYHSHEGFLTFSHAKAVHQKGWFNSGQFAYPQRRGSLLDPFLRWWLR